MATFAYIAKRPDGAETRGTLVAASEDAAREELRKRGVMLEDIREVPAANKPPQPKGPQPRPQQPRPQQQQRPPFVSAQGKQQNNQQRPQQKPVQQAKPAQPHAAQQPAAAPQQAKSKPAPLPWAASSGNGQAKPGGDEPEYAPLHETLRIFAGWLLGWYGVIYALGFLEYSKRIPEIPFVHELFESPLVLEFTFGTFLFLALSNVHRWLGKGLLLGLFLGLVYVAALTGFVIYG